MINLNDMKDWIVPRIPKILTWLGCAGVVGVGVTSALAGAKTENDIRELKNENPEISGGEILKKVAKNYILPGVLAVGTIGCVIGSEQVSSARFATVLSTAGALYMKSKKPCLPEEKEEMDKICESLGKRKSNENGVVTFDPSEVTLFYDGYSNEFFESTWDKVLEAEYHFNRIFILRSYAMLNEFYQFVGLPETEFGEINGWWADAAADWGYQWVDFEHILRQNKDGRFYLEIVTPFEPLPYSVVCPE